MSSRISPSASAGSGDPNSAPMHQWPHFSLKAAWRPEVKVLWRLSFPCIVCSLATEGKLVVSQLFIGPLGVKQFAAAGIANSWFNLLWCFLLGALTAIDTLASQAYGGQDYRSLLVWTISGLVVMTLYCIPLGVALFVSDHVAAVVFHQGYGEIADMVKQYCVALIPAMWLLVVSNVLLKYLQTQNSMRLPTAAVIVTGACHVAMTYGFVQLWGFAGAAWAITAAQLLLLLCTLAIIAYQQQCAIKTGGLTWGHWLTVARESVNDAVKSSTLWQVIKLSLAGGAMTAFEGGAFEVTTMFAGAFGTAFLAAHAALVSLCIFIYDSMPLAVATAATIRVGNLLGCGLPKQAQLSGCLSIALGFILQGSAGIAIGASQGQVLRMFTSDHEVLEVAEQVIYYAMAYQFSDAIFGVGQGILRGMGKQNVCLLFNAFGFWGCGVLVGWLLAFKANLGLPGLWIGMLIGSVVTAALSVIALLRSDWDKAADEAHEIMQKAALSRAPTGLSRDPSGLQRASSSDPDIESKFFVIHPSKSLPRTLSGQTLSELVVTVTNPVAAVDSPPPDTHWLPPHNSPTASKQSGPSSQDQHQEPAPVQNSDDLAYFCSPPEGIQERMARQHPTYQPGLSGHTSGTEGGKQTTDEQLSQQLSAQSSPFSLNQAGPSAADHVGRFGHGAVVVTSGHQAR